MLQAWAFVLPLNPIKALHPLPLLGITGVYTLNLLAFITTKVQILTQQVRCALSPYSALLAFITTKVQILTHQVRCTLSLYSAAQASSGSPRTACLCMLTHA
jgi:hypothetical protein